MNEKILLEGKFTKINRLAVAFFLLAVISLFISIAIYDPFEDHYFWGHYYAYSSYILFEYSIEGISICFWLSVILLITAIIITLCMRNCKITISDKRVFGKASLGKSINLPWDMISSAGTSFPQGIFVATSSGKIKFWLLANREEIYNTISELLIERQQAGTMKKQESNSSADELKKYKDLLDSGVITQEEFDAKKKQILGL